MLIWLQAWNGVLGWWCSGVVGVWLPSNPFLQVTLLWLALDIPKGAAVEEEVAGSARLSQNSGQNKRQANTSTREAPLCGCLCKQAGERGRRRRGGGRLRGCRGQTPTGRSSVGWVSAETDGVGTTSIHTLTHVCTYVRFV